MRETPAAAPPRLPVGTHEHFQWLHGIVKAVLVLNLLDATFTLLWVRSGLAREDNLMIDRLLARNPVGFVALKVALVGMGSWLLWQWRNRASAVVAIFIAFMAYYMVLLYHVRYAATIVRNLIENS
jgi:hypothetical protein